MFGGGQLEPEHSEKGIELIEQIDDAGARFWPVFE